MDRLEQSFESRLNLQSRGLPPMSGAFSRPFTPTDPALQSMCPRDKPESSAHPADQKCTPKPQQSTMPQPMSLFVSPCAPIPVQPVAPTIVLLSAQIPVSPPVPPSAPRVETVMEPESPSPVLSPEETVRLFESANSTILPAQFFVPLDSPVS